MTERASTTLRRMLDGPEIVVLPGAYDGLSARLAEQAGFVAMFTPGCIVEMNKSAADFRIVGRV